MQPEYAPGPTAEINMQHLLTAQMSKALSVETEYIRLFSLCSISLNAFCYVIILVSATHKV